jgi:hypothetical protein
MEDARTLPTKEVERSLPDSHPSVIFAYSMRLFKAGKQDNAVVWYYVGQIRYRFHLMANPDLPKDGDPALLASVNSSLGTAISDWAGGTPRTWANSINRALTWDATQPNTFTPKEAHSAELEQVRKSVQEQRDHILKTEAEILSERKSRGFDDR